MEIALYLVLLLVGLAAAQALVVRREVRRGGLEELVEAADHEVGLLVRVDLVARLHDAQQVEADAVRVGALEAVADLAARGEDAGAEDPLEFVATSQDQRRFLLAYDRFRSEGVAGWLSDRGMVYVALGEPDEVAEQLVNIRDRRLGTAQRVPVQIWIYRRHRTQLLFVDEMQAGRWELTPDSENEFRALTARLLAQ